MNKVIFGLILAVCILGMALLMLNERLGRKPEPAPVATAPQIITEKEIGLKPAPESGSLVAEREEAPQIREMSPEMAQVAREYEERQASQALAPPKIDDIVEPDGPRLPIREPEDMAREEPQIEPEVPVPPKPAQDAAREQRKPEPKPAAKAHEPKPQQPKPVAKPETKPEQKPAADAPKPAAARAESPKAAPGAGTITRFVVFARDKGATIRLNGDRTLRYKTINLENPDRIVIDIEGDWKFPPRLEVPKNELVNSARVGKNGDKTRLVIDLKEKPRTSRIVPAKNGGSLDVRIDK